MRIRRLLDLVVVTLSLLLVLGVVLSCGSINNVAFAQEKKITFLLWNWDSPVQGQEFTKRVEIFEKQTGVTVEIQHVAWNELAEKLRVVSLAGNPPDVVMTRNADYAWLAKGGILMDITSRADTDKEINLEDFNTLGELRLDGKLYALPVRRGGPNLVYNADLLKKVGIYYPPNTLAEVKEYAERVTKGIDGVYGYGLILGASGPFSNRWQSAFYSYGGEWLNKDGTDVASSFEEAALEAYKFYQDMAKFSPPTALSDDNDDAARLGATGKVAMWRDDTAVVTKLANLCSEEILKNIKYAIHPEGKYDPETNTSYRYTAVGGWNIVISAGSHNPEAAWEFMKFWASSENIAEVSYGIPDRKSALDAPRFAAIPEAFKEAQAKTVLTMPWAEELNNLIFENTQKIVLGKLSLEQATKLTVEKIRELLNK